MTQSNTQPSTSATTQPQSVTPTLLDNQELPPIKPNPLEKAAAEVAAENAIQPPEPEPIYITPLQHKAALLLSSGKTYQQVAAECHIGRSTLFRWRENPHFAAFINQQLQQLVDATTHKLLNLFHKAVDKLTDLLNDPAKHSTHLWKIINLCTNPHFQKLLRSQPTDPIQIANQQILQTRASAKLRPEPIQLHDYVDSHHRRDQLLARAVNFDAAYPDPIPTIG